MSAATAPSSKRPRGPLFAALVLLLALFVGGVAGVAIDRHLLLPRMFRSGFHRFPGPRDREFRNRFAREVGLSAEQQTRIDSIMDRQGRELRAVRSKVQPQLDSIIGRTRRELDSVLTPQQRKKAEEIRRRHPRPPGSLRGDFSPGPDGPPAGPPPELPPR
jgi:hypothetical protein